MANSDIQKAAAETSAEGSNTTDHSMPAETDDEHVSRISAAVARARGALDEVKAKVSEYDAQYKASETASAYLSPPIQKAQAAFDELTSTALMLKDKTVEIPTKALSRTLTAASSALEQITDLATKYDDKFKLSATVQKTVATPREKCASALVEVSSLAASVSAAANAQLQGVNQGICSRAVAIASSSASLIFSTAAALDGRFAIEDKAVSAGTAALGKAQQLDEKYNMKEKVGSLATNGLERARGLDAKVTGGRVTPLVLTAYEKGLEMAMGGLAFVQSGYESAKQERQGKEELSSNGREGYVVAAELTAASEVKAAELPAASEVKQDLSAASEVEAQ